MTPSDAIISANTGSQEVRDLMGRTIKVRTLTALDTLRLFKLAGPSLAQNQPWLSVAAFAMSVTEIDGVPLPIPVTETQIENVVGRLGEEGLNAIADLMDEKAEPLSNELRNHLGN